MPSPASLLRAPLLWLLVPFMSGLSAAKAWSLASEKLVPVAGVAVIASIAAGWLAGRSGRLNHLAWAACLGAAVSLGGFTLLHFREPGLHQWETAAPSEITVTLRVERVYPGASRSRSFSGIGTVVATGRGSPELAGRRLYFSALRKVSVTPLQSGSYRVRGVIESIPFRHASDSFDDYLANLGVRQKLSRARIMEELSPPGGFRRFCSRVETRLGSILSAGLEHHPEIQSLYRAMLLGEKAALSPEQQNAFMRSGTFHIFSISGLHVGVIALALHGALCLLRVPRRIAAVASLLLLAFYLEVTGMNSPALRAFLMICFVFGRRVFRLPGNALAALACAALVTLLLDPMQLFGTGFQMSYSVVAALVVMGVPLTERILLHWHPFSWLPRPAWRRHHRWVNSIGRWVLGSCSACWVAFIASVPSGIGYFHLFSPGSLPANLVIVPLASLAIISGFLSLLAGMVGITSLSALFNSSAALIILGMDWLAENGSVLPGVSHPANFTQPWMTPAALAALVALMLACLGGGWDRRYGGYWPPVALLALILTLGVNFG